MALTSSCTIIDATSSNILSSYQTISNSDKECQNENNSTEHVFYKKLVEYDDGHSGSNKKPWTQERIIEVIRDLKNIKVSMKKKSVDYYWMNKYEVITTSGEEYLIKKKHSSEPTVRIVPREQYFDLLSEIHLSCGHGGRDKMLQDIKNKFYIPKKAVEIFVQLCPVCNLNKSRYRNTHVRPIMYAGDSYEGGQFELIDFQSCIDGEFKWLLVYENKTTKFITLRPLKSYSVTEIASELLITFLTFGAPNILKSDLGNNFNEEILREISTMWPGCKIMLDSQIDFHLNSEEIEKMLRTWMNENNSTNWSFGCYFTQYQKNILFHRKLEKNPHVAAVFGCLPKDYENPTYTEDDRNNVAVEQMLIPEEQDSLGDDELPVTNIKIEIKEPYTVTQDPLNNQTDFEEKCTPPVSQNEPTDAFKCKSCNGTVHVICAILNDGQGNRLKMSCYVCENEQVIELDKNQGLKRSYEQIDCNNPNKSASLNIGQTVLVSVPKVKWGKFDTKFITGKIVDFRFGVYRVATKIGTIKNWFPRYDLQYVQANYGDVLDKPVTLDDVVAHQAIPTVEILQKCNCRPAVNQCVINRCVCFKKKRLCGPECHQRLTCINT